MKKFAIARYSFNSLFRDEADRSFLEDLMKEPYIEERKYSYAIGNVNVEVEDGTELVRGTFGRVRRQGLGDVYDKERKEFVESALPEMADVMIEFFIVHTHHLIFVELDTRINVDYFRSKFVEIYEHNAHHGGLNVDYIFEEKDVYEEIAKWDRIDKVILTGLRPSNPSSLPSFDNIERLIKEAGAADAKIQLKAPKPNAGDDDGNLAPKNAGLNKDSLLIKEGVSLSAHGYGKAKLVGQLDGEIQEVETRRFLKRVEIDFTGEGSINKITQTVAELGDEAE